MDISMTEEEKEEMRKEAEGKTDGTASPSTGTAGAEKPTEAAGTPASPVAGASAGSVPTGTSTTGTSTDLHVSGSGTSTPTTSHSNSKMMEKERLRQQQKLSAEQRKKMDELAEERRKNEIERVQQLTNKLKDRVRPFVTATNPGDTAADEYKRWEQKIREEVEDLKGQSFGYELCQLIGQIVRVKAARS